MIIIKDNNSNNTTPLKVDPSSHKEVTIPSNHQTRTSKEATKASRNTARPRDILSRDTSPILPRKPSMFNSPHNNPAAGEGAVHV